ncbi:hypothetical protein P8C59_008166 [Phyllachora maydis]|uniref:F-box domain-containing protein n=1 Tax=Phyllachora maydis TaxID=1825666 RepID=A0AAD9IBN8_9PEZI|nr:hypothetical protein P8C59_008166 [Phyllachora maydis]
MAGLFGLALLPDEVLLHIISYLIKVDLQAMAVVDCSSFPWSITTLSAAHHSVPLTVGTSLGIHLHDYRAHFRFEGDVVEKLDDFGLRGANAFYERSVRDLFDEKPLPPMASLSQPGPLNILHMPHAGSDTMLSDDIYVAGRFSNILHYDRRKFQAIKGSIFSGARLCSLASIPYPFSALDSELRRKGQLSKEQVKRGKSTEGGRTLVACGEYGTKGSLELYGLAATPLSDVPGGLQSAAFKNRQSTASSKLLSVVNHGTKIAFSDGSGYITWFERDGFTEIRRCKIGNSEDRAEEPSLFASMPGSDDLARKLLPTRQGLASVLMTSHNSFADNSRPSAPTDY